MHVNGHISVLIVDDHPGICAGVASLIEAEWPRLRCVGSANSAQQALEQTRALQPHVVVLDVNLGSDDGLALIPALHHLAPCAVLVLTSLVDPHVALRAQRLGARACLHKSAPAAELVTAIVAAWRADEYLPGSHQVARGLPADQAIAANRG